MSLTWGDSMTTEDVERVITELIDLERKPGLSPAVLRTTAIAILIVAGVILWAVR